MEITSKATLLTAESKPYSFEGNEGVSNKIRFNIGGEIFNCKATLEQVNKYKEYEGLEGVVSLKFTSRKENLSMTLVDFEKS